MACYYVKSRLFRVLVFAEMMSSWERGDYGRYARYLMTEPKTATSSKHSIRFFLLSTTPRSGRLNLGSTIRSQVGRSRMALSAICIRRTVKLAGQELLSRPTNASRTLRQLGIGDVSNTLTQPRLPSRNLNPITGARPFTQASWLSYNGTLWSASRPVTNHNLSNTRFTSQHRFVVLRSLLKTNSSTSFPGLPTYSLTPFSVISFRTISFT